MKRLLILVVVGMAAGSALGQDRPDLASDLWFRVGAADGHWVGFAHFRIENAVEDGHAVVRYFEEGQVSPGGAGSGWREEWTLDTDLGPIHGLSRSRSGGTELEVGAAFDGRELVRRALAPALERHQAWTRERPCWPAGLVPAALLRRYGPWHPGLEMSASSFSARVEESEVQMGEDPWRVVVKNRGTHTVADLEAECWTLEATPRSGAGSPSTIVVDARGLPVESTGAGWTMKRVRGEKEAKDGRDFAWAHAGRRDPFRPTLRPVQVRRVGEDQPPVEPMTPDEVRAILDDATAHLEAMQSAASLPEADRERALAENSRAIRLAAGRLRDSTAPGAAARITGILGAASRLFDPTRAAVSTAKALFKEIREAFEAGDTASLGRIAALMGSLHELATDPDLAGRPEQASVRQIEEEAAGLDRRAAIRIEGLERLQDHRPNGIMVVRNPKEFELEMGVELPGVPLTARPKISFRVSGAVAFLGEKSYQAGDAIDGVEGCVLKEILADAVVVMYRGEAIRMRIGE